MSNPSSRPLYDRVPSWADPEGIVNELMENVAAGTFHNRFCVFQAQNYIDCIIVPGGDTQYYILVFE